MQRVELLKKLREKTNHHFKIIFIENYQVTNDEADYIISFENLTLKLNEKVIREILSKRIKFKLDEVSTVMFTSGSTGVPKGIAFTNFNLLTKRFARGAALPNVGHNEVLLCYLPLFHTFGRYFEMLGMIYWGGTYVFAGKTDIDSLSILMNKVRPTGFVSIPLRWKQIYEQAISSTEDVMNKNFKKEALYKIVGNNLRWGISAAGYLEPKVFKFFNSNSIALVSGFGMTEGTGGISMTPPNEYVKDSVGKPLPGIKYKFSEIGELQISGVYVAKYLEDVNKQSEGEYWINTGDLFTEDKNGFLYIVDRVKDIYKNIRGQTIAPAFIEKKFEEIPGLKRAFLVGDMKPYNSLLIVPDFDEPFIKQAESQKKLKSYFGTLISAVNKSLNPYERIVKYVLIERNFDEQKGELTQKGTFKRKVIEANFSKTIESLYTKSNLKFYFDEIKVSVPIWAIKDLGITENDLISSKSHLVNKVSNTKLTVKKSHHIGRIKIGDFEYVAKNLEVDISIFILQPILWLGNKGLIEFFVCKEEWESDFSGISSQIFVQHSKNNSSSNIELKNAEKFDEKIKKLNSSIIKSLYGNEKQILEALDEIDVLLLKCEHKIINLLSRRLEALATHPKFSIRSKAYKVLLFNKPDIDYNKYLPAFINSGLPFLNKKVIENIFSNNIESFNLDAFRQRLEAYRKGLTWPANEETREQFKRILELLINYVHKNPSSYPEVRIELISWILLKQDSALSNYAYEIFNQLAKWYEGKFHLSQYEKSISNWKQKVIYQDRISNDEKKRIEKILYRSTFLKEAFILIFNQTHFDLKEVIDEGIFISTISASANRFLYRISVNTKNYKHYDLIILIKPDITRKEVLETIYLMIKISSSKEGLSVLPRLGNFRSKLGVISFAFINDLNVWERIRMWNSNLSLFKKKDYEFELKLLFIRGMGAFFKVLKNSDYSVFPGNFSPSNAVVPENHFKRGALIVSIAGWTNYKSSKEFFLHLYNNFYQQTYAHYTSSRGLIKVSWLFDSCLEALGEKEGCKFLTEFANNSKNIAPSELAIGIGDYLLDRKNSPYIDSYILTAIKNYNDFIEQNSSSTKEAKENFINNLVTLYRIDKQSELNKFIFFRETYFKNDSEEVKLLLEKLIDSLFKYPDEPAVHRIELVELQEILTEENDRRVLNNLILPSLNQKFELITEDNLKEKEIVLKTEITDAFGLKYTVRKPFSAFEIASLHKLFILDNYPVKIDPSLQYLIITDNAEHESIVGGLCYKLQYMNIAHLEGIDISKPYKKRGLGGKLIEDFCSRLKADGIKTLTTHFYLRSFFEKYNFKIDSRWGGLARIIQ